MLTRWGIDPDALGISVAAVHGVDFAPYHRLLGPKGFHVPRVVITDGDADPDKHQRVHMGLRRGSELLAPLPRRRVDRALDKEAWDDARDQLKRFGIFVGTHTLEIDILPAAADAMNRTLAELGASETVQDNFAQVAVAASDGSPEDRRKLIRYVDRYGKGRFAQRLAEHLDEVEPPAHIRDALTRLTERLSQ